MLAPVYQVFVAIRVHTFISSVGRRSVSGADGRSLCLGGPAGFRRGGKHGPATIAPGLRRPKTGPLARGEIVITKLF